jgi:HAD superfamily hydrolase (TIGR01450 family)
MKFDFSPFDAVLLDLDGTVYYEDHPLPGAVDLITRLQGMGKKFALVSNSTSSPARVIKRMTPMGMIVPAENIYTAGAAAVDYVVERFAKSPGGPRVYNLATGGVQSMLEGRANIVDDDSGPCDAVIIGAPANIYATPDRQRMALFLIRNGALAVGVCADRIYPSPRGLEFGSGALTLMLAYAANVRPVYVGKPEKTFFQALCRHLPADPTRCVLIGDNLESDIGGARAMGMKAILTLGGVTRRQDLDNLPIGQQPDLVINDLRDLL